MILTLLSYLGLGLLALALLIGFVVACDHV